MVSLDCMKLLPKTAEDDTGYTLVTFDPEISGAPSPRITSQRYHQVFPSIENAPQLRVTSTRSNKHGPGLLFSTTVPEIAEPNASLLDKRYYYPCEAQHGAVHNEGTDYRSTNTRIKVIETTIADPLSKCTHVEPTRSEEMFTLKQELENANNISDTFERKIPAERHTLSRRVFNRVIGVVHKVKKEETESSVVAGRAKIQQKVNGIAMHRPDGDLTSQRNSTELSRQYQGHIPEVQGQYSK